MPPWTAELTVSLELAQSLIAEQFPQLAPRHIEVLGIGWDNTAFLVDGQYVFRFPRRQLGADLMEVEIRVLPALAGRLPLPIPLHPFAGEATERFPWRFAGYRRLEGRTACSQALDATQRHAAAATLGEFLAALHAIGRREAEALGAPPDRLGRLDMSRRLPQVHERLAEIARLGLIGDTQAHQKVAEETAVALPSKAMTLVHGDVYVRHLLVDDKFRPCGIIDWGDMHVGSIALDLSIAHSFLPPRAHESFCRAYGFIDDATWRLARFRALHYGVILAQYGHAIDDHELLREALLTLEYVVQ